MKIAAIIANTAQLGIILAIFFIRGLDLGALVIFLLFLLMSVPFINILAHFFPNRPMPRSVSDNIADNGLVKRMAMRVRYPESHCPVMKTAGTAFTVVDISEGGVRVRASLSTPFKKKINGEIHLISGGRIRFKAIVMRREEGEVIFQFVDPIGTALLVEEEKAMTASDES
ncbi:PilZ domain-containing protein [uncultured Desulfosarcina sp.]|uniref:PilZ domain-containing protein n=1 Tax=uncultured Desulfosarcina sp. TaxID=218289 RepID=UPI0029C60B64|nr:PilZ domain-containing protein [uncultured Desulfosarcina sp.]